MITNKQIKELQPGTEYWVQWHVSSQNWSEVFRAKGEYLNNADGCLAFKGCCLMPIDSIIDIKTIKEMG